MTINKYSRPVFYSECTDLAVDSEYLDIVASPAEDQDGQEIVSLAIAAGPTLFQVNLDPDDARAVAAQLVDAADVHSTGGSLRIVQDGAQ
ncbi:hypothetical protein [Rhodococcus jostii]|uniref:hypothetical protein n=1 Tax=Rhodococcus jostii TaxID=132919 RepID=UPI00363FDE91